MPSEPEPPVGGGDRAASTPRITYQVPDDIGYSTVPFLDYEYRPSDDDPFFFITVRRLSDAEIQRKLDSLKAPVAPPVRTALHDGEGALLYVGISGAPIRRWLEHSADKAWWPEVSQFSVEWFESRSEALVAEAKAIRSEKPVHNVVHNAHGKSVA